MYVGRDAWGYMCYMSIYTHIRHTYICIYPQCMGAQMYTCMYIHTHITGMQKYMCMCICTHMHPGIMSPLLQQF